ncbi:MAG: hypothetical protein KDA96_12030 [Planctomycetaceae bacterium]|nr:hypothetical protein [Planctomycetaceae bacterium]
MTFHATWKPVLFLSLLAMAPELGTVAVAQPESSDRPMPSAPVIGEWKKAGAEFGWSTIDAAGEWQFLRERPATDCLPAFRFGMLPVDRMDKLPSPDFAFALWLGSGTTDEHLGALINLSRLQSLMIEGTYAYGVTDRGLQLLQPLAQLQALSLEHTAHTDAGLRELVALKELRILTLGGLVGGGLAELSVLKHLHSLHIISASVTDEGMRALPGLKSLRSLTILSSEISDVGLIELNNLRHLKRLSLRQTFLNEDALDRIGAKTQLESLNLWSNRITDAGIDFLTKVSSLRELNLSRTDVTNDGMLRLKPLSRLNALDLPGRATDATIDQLQRALPRTRITADRPPYLM